MNCSQCNQANVSGARYCRLCGSALESRLGAWAFTRELLDRTVGLASSVFSAWVLRCTLANKTIVSSIFGIVCIVSITVGIGVRQGWWVETRKPQRVEVTDPEKIRFADEVTGETVLWYYRSPGGDYELYDRPGFHRTGADLDEVDTADERRRITEYFRAEKGRLDKQERVRQEALAKQARQRELVDKQAREEQARREREAFLNRYLANRSPRNKPALTGIAVVAAAAASPRIERDLSTKLATTLRGKGIAVIEDLFTDALVADGLFDKLSAGSGQAAEQLDLGTYTDYVLLCKVDVSFSEHPTLQNVLSAAGKASVTLIKAGTGHVVTDISVSVTGPGFSEADAQNAAYERVAGAISEQLKLKAVLEGDEP